MPRPICRSVCNGRSIVYALRSTLCALLSALCSLINALSGATFRAQIWGNENAFSWEPFLERWLAPGEEYEWTIDYVFGMAAQANL